MNDLEALKHTLETGMTIPPSSCITCYYYNNEYKHGCNLFESKEQMKRCIKNDHRAGIRTIYLKEKKQSLEAVDVPYKVVSKSKHNGNQIKKKVYVNEKTFKRYSPDIIKRWGWHYDIEVYKFINNTWVKIKTENNVNNKL